MTARPPARPAVTIDPEAARQLAAYTRAIEEAAAELGRQLAPIGAAIAAWHQAVSAQLTVAFGSLAGADGRYSGRRAGPGDPCGNPHPPFRPPP